MPSGKGRDGEPKGVIDVVMNFTSSLPASRFWEIRVSQIPFSQRAPAGCLQYFTGNDGVIQVEITGFSFNSRVHHHHIIFYVFCRLSISPKTDDIYRIKSIAHVFAKRRECAPSLTSHAMNKHFALDQRKCHIGPTICIRIRIKLNTAGFRKTDYIRRTVCTRMECLLRTECISDQMDCRKCILDHRVCSICSTRMGHQVNETKSIQISFRFYKIDHIPLAVPGIYSTNSGGGGGPGGGSSGVGQPIQGDQFSSPSNATIMNDSINGTMSANETSTSSTTTSTTSTTSTTPAPQDDELEGSGDDGDDGGGNDAGGFFSLSSLLTRASLFRSFEPKPSKRSGRQYYSACNDRITMPCIVEDFIATGAGSVPSCSPVHCGSSLCPGGNLPCRIESTVAPFGLGIHFGDGRFKGSAEDNIGACLRYNQLACV